MRVLVVDDEPWARRRLARLLAEIPVVGSIEEAADGREALARAPEADVVLLDIQLPGLDGLGVARQLGSTNLIFTTASTDHALEAFDLAAVDYLVKPVSRERLERALARVSVRTAAEPRVAARGRDGLRWFPVSAITSFRALDKLTVFEVGGREFLLDESLASLEALPGFVRVHRGELVRVQAIVRLGADEAGALVELTDQRVARVSRRHLAELKRRLSEGQVVGGSA